MYNIKKCCESRYKSYNYLPLLSPAASTPRVRHYAANPTHRPQGRPRQHRRHHVHQGCRPNRGQHSSNQRHRAAGHQLLYRHNLRFRRHLRLYYVIRRAHSPPTTPPSPIPLGGRGGDSRLREPALFMYNFKRKNQGTRDPSLSKVCQSI